VKVRKRTANVMSLMAPSMSLPKTAGIKERRGIEGYSIRCRLAETELHFRGMTAACSEDSQNRMRHQALIDFFCCAEDEALGALRRLPI
jgi:hypothetical protein